MFVLPKFVMMVDRTKKRYHPSARHLLKKKISRGLFPSVSVKRGSEHNFTVPEYISGLYVDHFPMKCILFGLELV
jgi:hypothetical protein